jgi:phosphorylase kinase alpha/beta subunit
LESAVEGLLIYQWDRDSMMQALAEFAVALDSDLGAGLHISPDAWKDGLIACMLHHCLYQYRFMRIISGEVSGMDMRNRPHIRYSPFSLYELPVDWGHAQNDALGMINFLLFWAVNRGHLDWSDSRIQSVGHSFAVLLHHYFCAVHVWADWDLGAWEDWPAEHASSIGVVVAGLREQREFMLAHGDIGFEVNGKRWVVTVSGVNDLLHRCESKLQEVLPNEYIRTTDAARSLGGAVRSVDSALVNALLLSAWSGRALLDDAMTLQIIDNIERKLLGHIGICRYPRDVWDGRMHRGDLQEGESAQWCHVSPMISVVLGELYRRTGQERFLRHQTWHFNRALAHVNERGQIPEAYIVHPVTRQWVSDANEPLAWAQAMTLLAFAGMKASLTHQQKTLSPLLGPTDLPTT